MEQLTPIDYAYVNGDKWECIGTGEPMPIFTYNKVANQHLAKVYKERQLSDPAEMQAYVSQQVRSPVFDAHIKSAIAQLKKEWKEENQDWVNSPEGIEERLQKEPYFIRAWYERRVAWLKRSRAQKHSDAFLTKTVKQALLRLNETRKFHTVRPYKLLSAYYQNLYPHLPGMDKPRIKTLANEIASRVSELLDREVERLGGMDKVSEEAIIDVYRMLAAETFSLRVNVPGWQALKPKKDRWGYDKLPPVEPAFGSMARMVSADWWERQLWRLRCDWREDLFRASNQVHRKTHPYISQDGMKEFTEQRQRNSEFFRNHELEDEDGKRSSLQAMVLGSVSNPALRRNELMTRMQGVEFVAQERGDVGVFYTITCPSRYHATNHKGRMNDKWDHTRPPEAQRYLSKLWANIGSKLGRRGLRVYGFRVAEPHHDSTPHWHLLLFMRREDRKEISRIIHTYATKMDNAELVPDARARFNIKWMNPSKGSATAYIAKYISKNIDGYALDGELDDETGKPLKDTAKFATAWASRYRIRQYQPIGQPPVTVWRELRKLNNQLVSILMQNNQYNPKKPLLADKAMDSILAAADVGCWASFVDLMGGVLTPRENYVIGISYEDKAELNTYGEIVERIYGIYSRIVGEDSKICTRAKTWKIVPKKADSTAAKEQSADITDRGSLAFLGGFAAPRSSVNNSPLAEILNKSGRGINRTAPTAQCVFTVGKESITANDDNSQPVKKRKKKQLNKKVLRVITDGISSVNTGLMPEQIEKLATDGRLEIGSERYFISLNGKSLDGGRRKQSFREPKPPVCVPDSPPVTPEITRLTEQLESFHGLIELTGITTPPEALARQLLAGKPLILRDERYYLENGVIRVIRTAAAHQKRQQVVAAELQKEEVKREEKAASILVRVEKMRKGNS
ncbi:MAG TPA: replication endonuclease [Morganella sp. (in: Bacteria)]|nr:replication endonuclease [Morganella sp. (in: enterobacteria)]